MKQIIAEKNEAGQRLDKLLAKYLNGAPKSFLYKMLRKKNITLNGKKAQGNEILQPGDEIRLYLADETIDKFQNKTGKMGGCSTSKPGKDDGSTFPVVPLDIVYEDEHVLLINKPSGMLSQKARPEDLSLTEYLIGYLLKTESLTREQLVLFRPSVCNRLDRNTSGIVAAGKSLPGLQTMSRLLKEREVKKYYRCIVKGTMTGSRYLQGYLTKDETANQVTVRQRPSGPEDKPIETRYRALFSRNGLTLLEVHLITGRSHQIRAHLASIGHPILGDPKYGDAALNRQYRKSLGVCSQMLHAYRLEFPKLEGELANLSEKVFTADPPDIFTKVMKDNYGNLENPRTARIYAGRTDQPNQ